MNERAINNDNFERIDGNNNYTKDTKGPISSLSSSTTTIESDLEALGWQPHFSDQLSSSGKKKQRKKKQRASTEGLIPVRITEVRSKSLHVMGARGLDCLIPITQGKKIINDNAEKVAVVGDWILVEDTTTLREGESQSKLKGERTFKIHKVLNRRSVIKRRAPGYQTRKKQLMAANLNTVFVVSSCNQDFNVARLERYIAMVLETEHIEPVIILTKKDLMEMDNGDEEGEQDLNVDMDVNNENFDEEDKEFDATDALKYYQEEAGSIAGGRFSVVCLNALDGQEASALLQPWLGQGQTVAFVGSSGVGKSTLVNSICGTDVKTGDIHIDSGQGRHTTTRRQLHFLNSNSNDSSGSISNHHSVSCGIIDTPGLRELQLVDAAQGLDVVFSDFVELSHQCKFNDCTHSGEPGCAIASAVESGEIDVDRLYRWEKLVAEDAANTQDMKERFGGRKMG